MRRIKVWGIWSVKILVLRLEFIKFDVHNIGGNVESEEM